MKNYLLFGAGVGCGALAYSISQGWSWWQRILLGLMIGVLFMIAEELADLWLQRRHAALLRERLRGLDDGA